MTELRTDEIESFRVALEAMLCAELETNRQVVIMPGKRYARIVVDRDVGSESYAYGFIDMTNGDLLKTSSWKTPAKHARGNLRNDNPLSGCGPYGVDSMRNLARAERARFLAAAYEDCVKEAERRHR